MWEPLGDVGVWWDFWIDRERGRAFQVHYSTPLGLFGTGMVRIYGRLLLEWTNFVYLEEFDWPREDLEAGMERMKRLLQPHIVEEIL
jgi:hypothetical protein